MAAVAGIAQRPTKAEALVARLNSLGAEFGDSLAAKVAEVRRIWSQVPAAPASDEARSALTKIHEIVHTLAGAGKSFGFPVVSKAAAPLDGLFRLLTEHRQHLTQEEMAQIEILIRGLEDASLAPRIAIDLDDLADAPASDGDRRDVSSILILGAQADTQAAGLKEILAGFGYHCHIVAKADEIPAEVVRGGPAIIYADVSNSDEYLAMARRSPVLARCPLILASAHSGFADRLKAVQCGASQFLPKPFEMDELIERLTSLDEAKYERPYRVVIAEDDGPLSSFYQLTLEHAGMETRAVREPSKLLDTLSGFDPDLIVMDLYLPECSGLDLAQIVRQFPAYTTVPILFLSTETRLDLQLQARHLGADDFLPKPLHPSQLVSAVTSRANRYRDLKKLTDRDSLTGLLNHANILRNLEREMNLASRTGQPVAFAMIDIDHFKSVNDTYGHVVGDQVILHMTHLVRNRLRRVDYVGRYGGEEFAVVMPNTDVAAAKVVMDQLREAAADLEHKAEQGSFHVTFSSGVAIYPQYKTVLDVTTAADEALYKAKRGGRNQVVIAS